MKYLLTVIGTLLLFASCSSDDDTNNVEQRYKHCIIAYISAENNLSSYAEDDIKEMVIGSKSMPSDSKLIVFVDTHNSNQLPYIMQINNGEKIVDSEFVADKDFYASDPERMYSTINYIMTKHPSDDYGLILWGHASGWLISEDSVATTKQSVARRAYGLDSGSDNSQSTGDKWINTPTLVKTLERLPHTFRFIFADCCNFQCIENAYELKNVTHYIIGSPAEIPNDGAPYEKMIPDMCSSADDFYVKIVDDYYNTCGDETRGVPLSAVNTKNIDILTQSTKNIIANIASSGNTSLDSCIYYFYENSYKTEPVMYDMNDVILKNTIDSSLYYSWKNIYDEVVVYKKMSKTWVTSGHVNFSDFNFDSKNYGGMNMFVPKQYFDRWGYSYNKDIKKMAWYYAVDLEKWQNLF